MIIIFAIALIILMVFSVFIRTVLLHPFKTLYYFVLDLINYFLQHRYDAMETGKLICYTALFGGGKTLSCVHYIKYLFIIISIIKTIYIMHTRKSLTTTKKSSITD